MVAGLHKAFCQDIRPVQEAPEPGIELPGFFSREDLVVMVGFFSLLVGGICSFRCCRSDHWTLDWCMENK
jgi:hypothetical protein